MERASTRESAIVAPLAIIAALAAVALAARRRKEPLVTETFAGKTVVITGGSRGFGLALARRFAADGARLALLARDADELAAAAADPAFDQTRVLPVVCDVRDDASVRSAVETVTTTLGPVDVLVNNAGVIYVSPFEHATLDDFRDAMDTHFWGPLHLIRACLPGMMRQGAGRIVNVSSVGGRVSVPHLTAYSASKFALTGLSEGLHAELKPYGIDVTTVTPHVMRTGSHRNVLVRGRHAREALWFALGASTPVTSVDADHAADEVMAAVRDRRATVSPGWQSEVARVMHGVAPDLTAELMAAAVRLVLPSPDGAAGDVAQLSREIDLHVAARLFPTGAAARFNQIVAEDEIASQGRARHDPHRVQGGRNESVEER
jgi:NAD(P)-dependent dehydrogenase (short-subunit alcohol dehydrogenase family)